MMNRPKPTTKIIKKKQRHSPRDQTHNIGDRTEGSRGKKPEGAVRTDTTSGEGWGQEGPRTTGGGGKRVVGLKEEVSAVSERSLDKKKKEGEKRCSGQPLMTLSPSRKLGNKLIRGKQKPHTL